MIKIIAWNIQQGGGTRVRQIASALTQSKATIICLNEFKNNERGHKIRGLLMNSGYIHQLVGNSKSDKNTVLTASKIPFTGSGFAQSSETYPTNIVRSDFGVFSIYNMYLPHKKKHDLFEHIKTAAKASTKAIFVGDFNTGKQYIDQKGSSFMYSDYLDKLEEINYLDYWRFKHGDTREFSWYSHQGNGYRYDHIYGHESLTPIIKSCDYLHDWRMQKWSDHSPMELVLGS